MEPGGGDLGELPAVTLGVFIELVAMLFQSLRSRPLVEPHRLSGRISSGAAPPIPATEPRIVCCSCVKRFRKTFRPVFSNSFFVCLWASEGLEFGPPGGLFGPPGGSWALLGGPWAPRSIFERFWVPFGPPFGVQNRPWNAPRATSRPILPSWRVPGRVPEGLWEVILGTFLRLGWRERKKGTKSAKKH